VEARRTRVAHIISDLNIGGAGRYLLTLIRQSAFRDYDMTVLCPEGGALIEALRSESRSTGVRVCGLSVADRSFDMGLVSELYAHLRANRYDLVHTHASLAGRIAAASLGHRNIVLTRHSITWGEAASAPALRGLRRLVNRVVQTRLSAAFIAVSHAVRERLLEEGIPENRVYTIHNGVDIEEVEQEAACPDSDITALRARLSNPVVGSLGRLSREKGHEVFVRAMPLVLTSVPQATFVIAGEGPEKPRLQSLARELGVEDKVTFTGYVSRAAAVMNVFDVFVMPSLSEGLGLAMLEAMVLRKPVVATRTGGIPEVIEDGSNGLLAAVGDPASLAECVVRLLQDSDLARRVSGEGRRTVETRFSASEMARKTAALYAALLDRSSR